MEGKVDYLQIKRMQQDLLITKLVLYSTTHWMMYYFVSPKYHLDLWMSRKCCNLLPHEWLGGHRDIGKWYRVYNLDQQSYQHQQFSLCTRSHCFPVMGIGNYTDKYGYQIRLITTGIQDISSWRRVLSGLRTDTAWIFIKGIAATIRDGHKYTESFKWFEITMTLLSSLHSVLHAYMNEESRGSWGEGEVFQLCIGYQGSNPGIVVWSVDYLGS